MSVFKTKGYRDLNCVLSIAAIFPPPERARTLPDGKTDEDEVFHMTIVNNREQEDEVSAYICLTKKQVKDLNKLFTDYLATGITKENNNWKKA